MNPRLLIVTGCLLAGCNRSREEPFLTPPPQITSAADPSSAQAAQPNPAPANPSEAPAPAPAQPAPQPAPARPSGPGTNLPRPTVAVPRGEKPTALQTRDLVVGTGAEARTGQTVDVQYVGVAWSTGREFDSSWSRNAQPFSFPLGSGQVIRGWDQGVAGMRVGGRRQLIIPPDLAYGPTGAGGAIGPNETLIFVVDLIGVR